ncbi:MAG: hypothetical protein ACLQU4_14965 [Limisphaerales bacterium]
MKTKLILIIGLILMIAATVVVMVRQQSRRSFYGELPQVMNNYQKTFKLDTSPAIFPDNKTVISPNQTNAAKP